MTIGENQPGHDAHDLPAVGAAAVATGVTAIVVSQVELVIRADGDYSLWGFAIVGSLLFGALFGGGAALLTVIAWAIRTTRGARLSRRAGLALSCALLTAGLLGATTLFAAWSRHPGFLLPTAAASSLAGILAILWVSARSSHSARSTASQPR